MGGNNAMTCKNKTETFWFLKECVIMMMMMMTEIELLSLLSRRRRLKKKSLSQSLKPFICQLLPRKGSGWEAFSPFFIPRNHIILWKACSAAQCLGTWKSGCKSKSRNYFICWLHDIQSWLMTKIYCCQKLRQIYMLKWTQPVIRKAIRLSLQDVLIAAAPLIIIPILFIILIMMITGRCEFGSRPPLSQFVLQQSAALALPVLLLILVFHQLHPTINDDLLDCLSFG